jgi:2,3-bisphosphoglycerate-dependent phosphoglycerate mutase
MIGTTSNRWLIKFFTIFPIFNNRELATEGERMNSVYLVRHGKSSLEGTETERGLEPEGEAHAEAIRDRLVSLSPPVKAIYSSPYRRAQLTMGPLADRLGLSISVVDDFREKEMSGGPVADMKEARLKMWDDFDFRLLGGESNREAQQRALGALEGLRRAHPDEAVAVGSHGTLIALVLNSFMPDFGYEAWRAMLMPDIYRIDFPEDGEPVIDHVDCPTDDAFQVQG